MKPITNELLSTKVARAVKAAIISGELPPGNKTSESQIATILGVSRTPVREALRQLNAQGFVSLVKNSGVIIADFTMEDTLHILQVRGVLEGLAARLAATRITTEQERHLRSVCSLLNNLSDDDSEQSGEEFMLADRSFHDCLIEIAGNPHISLITDSIKGRLLRLHTLLISLSEGKILNMVREQHGAILEAVAAHQADRAEQLSRQHMGLMGAHVEQILAERAALGQENSRDIKHTWDSLQEAL